MSEIEFNRNFYRLRKISSLIDNLNEVLQYSLSKNKSQKNRISIQLEQYRKEYIKICSMIEEKTSKKSD